MELRLINNSELVLTTLPSSIGDACTQVFVKQCTNVSGIGILRACPNLQTVYINIGSVSGSIEELTAYSNLAGFNSDGTIASDGKPRIFGTFTVNTWHTPSQITAIEDKFADGLTIVSDPSKLIDFSSYAVQTLDPSEANYNPAIAIILKGKGFGTTLTEPVISGGGRWFMTKTEAALKTDNQLGAISTKATTSSSPMGEVTDTNGIVSSDTSATYKIEEFDEYQYFTNITTVKAYLLCNCQDLESVTLPSSVTVIDTGAFAWCVKLKGIIIPNGVTTIKTTAFSNCIGAYILQLPQSIETIEGNAFQNYGSAATIPSTNLINLNLPNLTNYSTNANANSTIAAFWGCCLIKEIVDLGNITKIGNQCFRHCQNLTSISLSNNIVSINSSFQDCDALTSVTLGNAIISITGTAFYQCNSLATFPPIPATVTNLGDYALAYIPCTEFRFLGDENHIPTITSNTFSRSNTNPDTSGNFGRKVEKIYVGDGSSAAHDDAIKAAYQSAWSGIHSTILNALDTWYNHENP